jgi:AraC-like DNA-binding protein
MLKKLITIILFFLTGFYASAQITFVVESLPAATPVGDTIFLCGSFNDWATADASLALQRQLNGQLAITIALPPGKYEYKFTRGSWTKVETDHDNHYTQNRTIAVAHKSVTVTAKIVNWLDLGGARPLNYMIFYFFACAFQAIALCFLVYRIQKKDSVKFQGFLIINAIFVLLLFLMVYLEIADQIWQTYFGFFFQFAFFCWGPMLLYFFQTFTLAKQGRQIFWYGIPALITLLFTLVRLLNIQAFSFLSNVIWPPVTWATGLVTAVGLVFNIFIFFRLYRTFPFLKVHPANERDAKANLLYYFFWISFLALLLVPFNVLLLTYGAHHPSIEYFHTVALVLSALIFIETYFLWRYPEVIREERAPTPVGDYSPELVSRLKDVMLIAKPFRKADLTISDLADMLGTRPHILSRIINDQYDRNFRDFLNAYRIEEFIALANTKAFRHYTFLALAQEAGFNSKSTFNLAFKKFTNKSPREYFKTRETHED